MKNLVYLLIFFMPFFSCVSKKSADKLATEKDSLAMLVAQKDSVINDVFASVNGIAENLEAIKTRENLITSNIGNGEIKKQATTQISQDIESINQLLLENRETIARLRNSAAQLKKANVKISGLEKLINQLNEQIKTKDREIVVLKDKLEGMHVQVASLDKKVTNLSTQVAGLSEEKSSLQGEVKNTTDQLNSAYYILGSEKELLSKEIVYKSGFIGRTLKINENRSLESFTKVDIRNFDVLAIGQKKVTVVSSHPAGSFELKTNSNGLVESITITDPARFWEYSKVLVVSYK